MKHIRLIIGMAGLIAFASCNKELTIKPLDFSVTADKSTYNVGDTVHFSFTGNPDIISLYSGEDGNNYEFRERTIVDGKPQLQFTSFAQYGVQVNTLQLMVSTDFTGTYDAASIAKATWTDVTARATLSTGADNTPSGIVDLSDILAQKKPVFISFKFIGTAGSIQKTWTIKNLTLNLLKTNNQVLPITDIASAGWKQVSIQNAAVVWAITAPQLRIQGGNATVDANEDWVISKLLYLNQVAPDVSLPIKNITQKVDSFDYVFSAPGNYKVVFLAANATADKQESTTKEIDLTIK